VGYDPLYHTCKGYNYEFYAKKLTIPAFGECLSSYWKDRDRDIYVTIDVQGELIHEGFYFLRYLTQLKYVGKKKGRIKWVCKVKQPLGAEEWLIKKGTYYILPVMNQLANELYVSNLITDYPLYVYAGGGCLKVEKAVFSYKAVYPSCSVQRPVWFTKGVMMDCYYDVNGPYWHYKDVTGWWGLHHLFKKRKIKRGDFTFLRLATSPKFKLFPMWYFTYLHTFQIYQRLKTLLKKLSFHGGDAKRYYPDEMRLDEYFKGLYKKLSTYAARIKFPVQIAGILLRDDVYFWVYRLLNYFKVKGSPLHPRELGALLTRLTQLNLQQLKNTFPFIPLVECEVPSKTQIPNVFRLRNFLKNYTVPHSHYPGYLDELITYDGVGHTGYVQF
jgi:hypothetical protein